MDSFETLLYVVLTSSTRLLADKSLSRELADILGQVKPPTASKEDIERSGLEVIQASSLEEYEKTERVASNCTERVWNFTPSPKTTSI